MRGGLNLMQVFGLVTLGGLITPFALGYWSFGEDPPKPKPPEKVRRLPVLSMETPPDVAAPPKDAIFTASGLAYKVLRPSMGRVRPGPEDKVKVHYSGWTTDGKMFDSSLKRNRPATFPLNRVIQGWTEGLQLMVEEEIVRFWIPAELAYKNKPGRPMGMLVFDVELLEIIPSPPLPPTPEDVAAPPKDAIFTKSGLAYRVLSRRGNVIDHPSPTDRVKVHYAGWTHRREDVR